MTQFAGERLVQTHDHPALGRLELWAWPRPRALRDMFKPRQEYLEWRGVSGGLPFVVSVDVGVDPDVQLTFLDVQARAVITSLGDREPEVRRETARREIDLARDWSGDPTMPEEAFAKSLRCSGVTVYTDAEDTIFEIHFDDTAKIFAGHVVTVVLDRSGDLLSTGIEG